MDDLALLEQYVDGGSTESLDELVRRHIGMVHAAALRQVGDPHLAEDVTQAVFVEFMRCAGRLSKQVVIAGWLFNTTRFIAFKLQRSRWRRARHEKEAATLRSTTSAASADPTFDHLCSLLDDAIAALPSIDRDAVVLRYLQGKSFREVGELMQVSEEAARKRAFRAIERLRAKLSRRGLAVPEDALAGSLGAIALQAAPPSLAPRVISAMKASAIAGATFGIANLITRILFMLNAKTVALAFVVMLAVCGAGGAMYFAWSAQVAPTAAGNHNGPGTTPLATVFNAFDAANAGNADALIARFDQLTPEIETRLRGIARSMADSNQLRDAIAARFGAPEAQNLVRPLGMLPPMNYGTMQQGKTVIKGNTATVQVQHIGTMPFVKVGDVWKFPPEMEEFFPSALERQDATLKQLEQLVIDVKAGKYATLHDLRVRVSRVGASIQNSSVPPRDLPPRPVVLTPGATPKETVAAAFWASRIGDEKALLACMNAPNEVQAGQLHRHATIGEAFQKLSDAIAENFNQNQAQRVALKLGMETGVTGTLLTKAAVTETGDKAHVDLHPSVIPAYDLIKKDGVWLIDPSYLPPPNPQWAARYQDYYLPTIHQITTDLNDGKYETFQQLHPLIDKLHEDLKADYQKFYPSTAAATPKNT